MHLTINNIWEQGKNKEILGDNNGKEQEQCVVANNNNNNTSWPLRHVQPLIDHKCSTSNETQNHKLKHKDEERNNFVVFCLSHCLLGSIAHLNQPLT